MTIYIEMDIWSLITLFFMDCFWLLGSCLAVFWIREILIWIVGSLHWNTDPYPILLSVHFKMQIFTHDFGSGSYGSGFTSGCIASV
jgi:hypothetical protein